MQELSGDAR